MKVSLPEHKTNTFEKFLFNVCLLKKLAEDFEKWFNSRLPSWQKTTTGEIIKFWGVMLAATQLRGVPFDSLWRETPKPGDIVSPPNFGRFGISKNRARVLKRMHYRPFNPEEAAFNYSDPNRYIRSLINAFNDHREKLIVPSWLLVGDESMAQCACG